MNRTCRSMLLALTVAAMPAIAAAQDAFTLQPTDVYAGPSSEYPSIATLPPNAEVGVAGCLSDWSWCDVTYANDRGWVWAGDLGYPYENQRVAIVEYGPRLRLPVVTFSLETYWNAHYRSRPFFGERSQWVSRVHVEGGHGGTPPHGGTRVARPNGGAQPAQAPTAQGAQPRQPSQGMEKEQQRHEQAAQPRQPSQGMEKEQQGRQQGAQAERERPHEQARPAQPSPQQANEAMRSREEAGKSSQQPKPQPEARATQPEKGAPGAAHERPSGEAAQQGANRPEANRPEANNSQANRPEAARAEPERSANAKAAQGERSKEQPKEEHREGNQQQ